MSWFGRLVRGSAQADAAGTGPDAQHLMRVGFDCENRGDRAAAEAAYRRVLELHPEHAEASYGLGRLAAADRRTEEAVALLTRATELAPRVAVYRLALGDVYLSAERYAEAAEAYLAGIRLQPQATAMRNNYLAALIHLDRRDEARGELERLRELLPDLPEIHFNLGGIYREYARTADAIACYRRVLELTPDNAAAFDNLLLELNYGPDEDPAALSEEHRRFGERFARRYSMPAADLAWPRRLRIGYLSPDLRNHVVARFLEPILCSHDRERFEVFCYFTHQRFDEVSERLRAAVKHWTGCDDLTDAELADRIRRDRIDVLVELAGHTVGNRLRVLALKPAPVQASYLGYPNTTGLEAVDYRITDALADPPGEADRLSVERLVRLPGSYFCYRPNASTPEVAPSPAAASGRVTFGCFSNFAKMSNAFLDAAARVVNAVPGSRLVLKSRPLSLAEVAARVRERFARNGVDLQRIELRGWEKSGLGHMQAYNEVDIALDSFPYAGATTTCEATWMGVPVITLAGRTHAGRMGVSLMTALGLPEHVAQDVPGYVSAAVRLASDVRRLETLRQTLRERMRRSPLMDEARFTRSLEQCYLEMWRERTRPQTGLAHDPDWVERKLAEAERLRVAGKPLQALEPCRDALRRAPAHRGALSLLWDLGFEAGSPGASIDALAKAIAIGEDASLHYMQGCALQATGKYPDAMEAFGRALELEPGLARAHNNLGCVLELSGRLDDAAAAYRRAATLDPGLAQAHYNLGKALLPAGQATAAVESMQRGLAIEPNHADWQCHVGEVQLRERRLDDAVASYHAALAVDPAYPAAYRGLSQALLVLGLHEDAVAAMRKALELDPGHAATESWLLDAAHYRVSDRQALFDRHATWNARHAQGLVQLVTRRLDERAPSERLRIGYLCDGFERGMAAFVEPVLAAHDRRRFEIFVYGGARPGPDAERRLAALGCTWRGTSGASDEGLAHVVRADGIDVLVDLAGHSGGRLLTLAHRPAAVQASWLGYPDTTGLSAVDYRITDAVLDPPGSERYYVEKLVRLDGGSICFAPGADGTEAAPASAAPTPPTFACFEELARIGPDAIALWSRVLNAIPGSRLALKASGLSAQSARRRVWEAFEAHGVPAARLELAATGMGAAAWRGVDIVLDASPWNGMIATCEALWAGVPVVTLAGGAPASRTGASLLRSAGLPDLVADSAEQYADIALRLADDAASRGKLRAAWRERLRRSPLLDAASFARKLEAAYLDMWSAA